jgi:hypothetical protein
MSLANPLWGAPRIHGELLKLGSMSGRPRWQIHGEEKATTVAGLEDLSAQSCRRHCVDGFVRSPDDFVCLLYGFLILQHFRRELLLCVPKITAEDRL